MAPSRSSPSTAKRPTRTSSRTASSSSSSKATTTKSVKATNTTKHKDLPKSKNISTTTTTTSTTPIKAVKRRSTETSSKVKPKRAKGENVVKESEGEESKEDEEEANVSEEEQDESSEADYKEEGEEDDDDDESDLDDFQDTDYGQSSTKKNQKNQRQTQTRKGASASASTSTSASTSASSKKNKSSKNKNHQNPEKPTHSIQSQKQFLISDLKIPRPPKPVADAIQPETLEFIRDLKLNNDREYMEQNRQRFETAKADFLDFIRMVKEGLLEADPDVLDQEPKDSMMRIYRDVRFSNDKRPYKRQLCCHFSKGGKKSIAAGYFFGVTSGGETFAGAGVWDPQGPVLHRIRQGIVNHSDRFSAILETEPIKKITGGKTGIDALRPGSSQLKTGPVGFEKDHPMIEFLKRKCFAIGRHFSDKEVVNEGFLEEVLQTFDACVDLVHILNEWIG